MLRVHRRDDFTEHSRRFMVILQVENLTKRFANEFTLGPLQLQVPSNECLGVLGKNGAGKSTFFQLVTGNLDATEGAVNFLGKKFNPDAFALKRQIGYLPQNLDLPNWVTAKELLIYAARLYQLDGIETLVQKAMGFWDCLFFQNRPMAACSHGMKKRVALALATLHQPKLLVLDEPFSGLDLFHIKGLMDTMEERKKMGLATILSSHVAPYVAKFCDSVLVLQAGKRDSLPNWENQDYLARIDSIEDYFFKK